MEWKITGLDRETGKASIVMITAPTEQFAVKLAGEKGLMVEKIEAVETPQKVILKKHIQPTLEDEQSPSILPDMVCAAILTLIGFVCLVSGAGTVRISDETQSVYSVSSAVFTGIFWILAMLAVIEGRLRCIIWNLDRWNSKTKESD
jgi:hypothetical protein